VIVSSDFLGKAIASSDLMRDSTVSSVLLRGVAVRSVALGGVVVTCVDVSCVNVPCAADFKRSASRIICSARKASSKNASMTGQWIKNTNLLTMNSVLRLVEE
jgi:hypothetical protein